MTNSVEKIHFLGIGGSGTSAAAGIAQAQGYTVTGCDKDEVALSNEFASIFDKSILSLGHSPDHLHNVDLLVITPAILSLDPNNEELKAAKEKKIKIMTWQQFMGRFLMKNKYVIAVCGSHGKSTTTAMIGLMLEDSGLDPTVELGAIIPEWGTNFRVGKGKYFVTEADEFNDNFLSITPNIAVVINIDFDHPEYFKNPTAYKRSFQNFLHKTKDLIIANLEDPVVAEVLAFHLGGGQSNYGLFFKPVVDYSKVLIDFPLKVIGHHNRSNATAAFMVGKTLGLNQKRIEQNLANYTGIGRRMEFLGKFKGADVYLDFGHHPTEIKTTIEAVKEKFPDKDIILVYQPHMFSRTKALFKDFIKVFSQLEIFRIYIMDIYPSREIDTGLVDSEELVDAIDQKRPPLKHTNTSYAPYREELIQNLKHDIKEEDIMIFMGAGDIDKLAKEIVKNG
ncbi:UDP-N-acetylmuramate--L-alanine ligase [Candidatus Daviesbacteria bacterium]|nr:UDP-N-acetylmuramate--L-alanine ligase [Candidatus Daviesbacteria bacterium]